MIFSLLNLRKKTAAALAGIAIAGLCLWGLSIWQDIPVAELFGLLGAVLLMIGAIMLAAAVLILLGKLALLIVGNLSGSDDSD